MQEIVITYNIISVQCMYAKELMRAEGPEERATQLYIFLLVLTKVTS